MFKIKKQISIKEIIAGFQFQLNNKLKCRYPDVDENGFLKEDNNILLQENTIVLCNMKKCPERVKSAIQQDFTTKLILEQVFKVQVNCFLYFSNGDENITNVKFEACKNFPNFSYLFWLPFFEAAKFTSEISKEISGMQKQILGIKNLNEKIVENQKELNNKIIENHENQKEMNNKIEKISDQIEKIANIIQNLTNSNKKEIYSSKIKIEGEKVSIQLY